MVEMRMADDYMADRTLADRLHQRVEILVVVGAGIDDGKRLFTHQIRIRATEGEWTRISRGDTGNPGMEPDRFSVGWFKTEIKFQCQQPDFLKPQKQRAA